MKTIPTILTAAGLAIVIAVLPAEARGKPRSVVGCLQAREGRYELSAFSKKGKPRQYALTGDHNFAKDVGHRVRVAGVLSKRTIRVSSVQTIGSTCR